MQSKLNPYISFKDNAREALTFYHSVFGGNIDLRTYKELGGAPEGTDENLIMHGAVESPNGLTLMGADNPKLEFTPKNMSIALTGDNDAELSGFFEKLSAGGTVMVPLEAAPWGDKFGMFTDKFGIDWMVNIAAQKS